MQVTKLRTEDNGLVPAGAYFARLAANLREQNERGAAIVERGENQERKLEARYRLTERKTVRPPRRTREELRVN